MPHSENINSPITLVGARRSGSSLVSSILGEHSQCASVGDTVELIHGVTKAMESSLPENKQTEIPEILRQLFLKLFHDSDRCWVQQAIGLPIFQRLFAEENDYIEWFWKVLKDTFPSAICITVMRHPLDTIASQRRATGDSYEEIVRRQQLAASLISHERSKVTFALNYHELISDPETQVERLLDKLALNFEPQCLAALQVAQSSGKFDEFDSDDFHARRALSFSHRHAWPEIPAELLTIDYRRAIETCWQKLRLNFCGWQ